MNNFLLRGLLGATVCLVAGSAFAQTTETATIGVSNDVTLRKDAADKTFATNTDLELYTLYTDDAISTDFIGAMSFDIPSKPGYVIKSATLRLVTERYKGSATLAIYSLGNNAVSDADTYNSQKANVEEARKNGPFITITPKGTHGKAAFDGGVSSDINDWTNYIDLTLLAQKCGSGKLNLLFVNPSSKSKEDVVRFYSSDAEDMTNVKVDPNFTFAAEDLHPQLTVVYEEIKDAKQDVSLPTADTFVRNAATNNSYGTNPNIEVCSNSDLTNDFVGLLSFQLPEDIKYSNYVVNNVNMRIVTRVFKGDSNMNVYAYQGDVANNLTYTNAKTAVADARSAGVVTTFKAAGQWNWAIDSDVDKLEEGNKTIDKWQNYINLTPFLDKVLAENNTINLMIESAKRDGKSTKFFSSEQGDITNKADESLRISKDDLVPQLTVDYALATHTLKVTEAGAATLVLPYETEIPENVKAYTLTYASGNKAVATELTGVIPANTPVLVNAQEGKYTFKATATLTTKADKPVYGNLHGVWNEDVVPVGSYVLQNQNSTVAFYRVATEDFKIQPNQAYLYAPKAANVRMLSIGYGGDGTTAINGIEAATTNANDKVYTIDGKKVNGNNLAKGQIYISNGKKFILK
mgnify:CR=1 FL=1